MLVPPRLWIWALCLGLFAAFPRLSPATEPPDLGECPIMPWEPPHAEIFLETEDQGRLYFCCDRCRYDWLQSQGQKLKGPLKKLSDAGLRLDRALGSPGKPLPSPELETKEDPLSYLGRFHPATVHFPIVAFVLAFLAEIFFTWTRRRKYRDIAHFLILVGACLSPVVAALGWCSGGFVAFPMDLQGILEWHKWLGVGLALGSLVLAYASSHIQDQASGGWTWVYRILLLAAALTVLFTAGLGGLLVYGPDHYSLPG